MDNKFSPSERLKARLSALQEKAASAPRKPAADPAQEFVRMADQAFSDPFRTITARWTKQADGAFLFTRSTHDFSDYESFAARLVLILRACGAIPPALADELFATITYANGKARVEREERPAFGLQLPNFNTLLSDGYGNEIPKSFEQISPELSRLVDLAWSVDSPSLAAWLAGHVGGQPGIDPPSRLVSDQQGQFGLPLGIGAAGKLLYYRGETSLLTIAPPGKGKTQCHVLPTLASYRGAAIVLDIKGECYDNTADWRRDNVGPVYRFNPDDPAASACYNPLSFVDTEADELWISARFLADLLIVPQSARDPVWEQHAREFVALLVAVVLSVAETPEERTMSSVLDLMSTLGLAECLEEVSSPERGFPSAMRRSAARFLAMSRNAPKQFEGVMGAAAQHMQVWEGPKVERVTARSDWAPEDFRNTPSPTLFLCVPPNALETYAPLLRVIIAQHVRRLMKVHGPGAAPILFLLDELPRLGRMEPVREALETGRSYGIKLWMIAQYPEQLTAAYPGVGEGMMSSCDLRMYMNPSASTADMLEKAFGEVRNVVSRKDKPAMPAPEILGPAHRDSIFVLASNEAPMVLRKKFFHIP